MSLYAEFNDLLSAVSVFNQLWETNTLAWNLIIKAHVDWGHFDAALLLYRRMRELGFGHDGFTLPIINRAISSLQSDVAYGEMVHCVAMVVGFGSDVYVCNTLIDVYVKCGFVSYARKVFDEMLHRDLISWTSMILGYVCEGSVASGYMLFNMMRMELEPNFVTTIVMLQACSTSGSVIEGRVFHGYVIKKGFLVDGPLKNSILRMYSKTGGLEEIVAMFHEIETRDAVSWNILISCYSSRDDILRMFESFREMQKEFTPSIETVTSAISAIAKFGNLSQGEILHCLAIKSGLSDSVLQTCLLDFYAKYGKIETSTRLFREISYRSSITCGAMMSGFIQNGYFHETIELFQQVKAFGLEPGADMVRHLVDAFTQLGALHLAKGMHGYLVRNLLSYRSEEDSAHLGTCILNMYIRCGSISSARVCFNSILLKDIVAWTSMIEGCAIHGLGFEALEYFDQMVGEGLEPNNVTFLSLLSACSHSGLVTEGCEVFNSMKWRFGVKPDLNHYTCIVDLLGRAGQLKQAFAIIFKMAVYPDSRIWGALLAASRIYWDRRIGNYAAHRLLELEPDNVGYYTLLSNVQASDERWADVENVRRIMNEKDLWKIPGWSCIEANRVLHGFVSGDKLHPNVAQIYEVLGCLSGKIKEIGFL